MFRIFEFSNFLSAIVDFVIFISVFKVIFAAGTTPPVKCCQVGFALSDDLKQCVIEEYELHKFDNQKIFQKFNSSSNSTYILSCFQGINYTLLDRNVSSNIYSLSSSCVDFQKNGSLVYLECKDMKKEVTDDKCDSVFTFMKMYGFTMMVFANIIYLCIYCPVCMIYIIMPKLCRRAYDKTVLAFTITQIILSVIIIIVGHFLLCHKYLSKLSYSLIGIVLMILTISSVMWLLVICFDVASTITKFRWAPSSSDKSRNESHKFKIYCLWVFLVTMLPTTFSTILEFSPLPDENIVKPNFHTFTGGGFNFRVVAHVFTVPLLVAITSNILFIYTTIKMFQVQKSTNMANENRKNNIKKKYILYLQLYLLMDAPYITGALGSAFEDLWILKFCRMLQPILMLYAVLPRHVIRKLFLSKRKLNDEKEQIKPKTSKDTTETNC